MDATRRRKPRTDKPLAALHGDIPSHLTHLLPRDEELNSLKQKLLAGDNPKVGVTGQAVRVGVHGMGGIGKSVLAAELARDGDVRRAFPDGVFWLTLGQSPALTARQSQLAEALGDPLRVFEDAQQGKARLRELTSDKRLLLILDDVWNVHDAAAFDCVGADGRTVLTTRDNSLIVALDAQEHRVDLLNLQQSLSLLAQWTNDDTLPLPPEAGEVAKECGYLPLALAMVGAMVRGRPDRWKNVLHKLRNADLDKIKADFPDYPYHDLLRAIQVSVDALQPQVRDCYLDFAVFPEDTPIPEAVFHTLWAAHGLDEFEAQDAVETLVNHSLMHRDDAGRLRLHDLQFDYVRKQVGEENLPQLHVRLLEAYTARCGEGMGSTPYCFAHGRDDGYFFQRLAYHLRQAGVTDDLRKLLLHFDWIQSKLDATDAVALIADYDFPPEDDDLRLVKGALRLSAHVLARDKTQLAGQLIGRLLGDKSPKIQELLHQARQWKAAPWLRPLTASLIHAGSPLIQTIVAHTKRISAMQLTADGKRVITASHDHTIKIWDAEQNGEVRTIQAHNKPVTALSATPDGRWAVSRSHEKQLKVWDLEMGEELRSLPYSACLFNRIAIMPDGSRAVVDSTDNALVVLDLMSGDEVVRMMGHERLIRTFVMNSKGDRVVSGSDEGIVKVWNTENGIELLTLTDHEAAVDALAVSSDGSKVASASYDETVRIWDMESGETLQVLNTGSMFVSVLTFAPHRQLLLGLIDGTLHVWDLPSKERVKVFPGHGWGRVTGVGITPDGRHAISAGEDNRIRIWDLGNAGQQFAEEDESCAVTAVAITDDGKNLLLSAANRPMTMRDLATLKILRVFEGHDRAVRSISVPVDSGIRIRDLRNVQVVVTNEGHGHGVKSISVSKDRRLAVTTSLDHTMKVWDLNSGSELLSIDGKEEKILEAALTPDGRRAVNATFNNCIPVWDIETGMRIRTLDGHTEAITAVAIMPDVERAVSASHDCTIRVWHLQTGEELRSILYAQRIKQAMDDPHIMTLAPLSDGRNLLVGYSDGILAMWDLEQGVELYKLLGHDAGIYKVVVARDDLHAVSSSWDHTLRFWDLKERRIVATFSGDSPVYCCALSPDGKTVVAGGGSGALHFLRLAGV